MVETLTIFVISNLAGRHLQLFKVLYSNKLQFRIEQPVFFSSHPEFFDSARSYLLSRRKNSLPELGCAQAHKNIYDKMIKENIPLALIFEDDAIILDFNRFTLCVNEIRELNTNSALVASFYSQNAELKRFTNKQKLWRRCHGTPSGAVAYIINKKAAESLRSANKSLDYKADWPPSRGLTFLLNTDQVVSHSETESMISESRIVNELSTSLRLANTLDLLLFNRYFKLKLQMNINLSDYLTLLYFPVILRIIRRITHYSEKYKT